MKLLLPIILLILMTLAAVLFMDGMEPEGCNWNGWRCEDLDQMGKNAPCKGHFEGDGLEMRWVCEG